MHPHLQKIPPMMRYYRVIVAFYYFQFLLLNGFCFVFALAVVHVFLIRSLDRHLVLKVSYFDVTVLALWY